MIRYPDALDDIEAAVELVAAGWSQNAAERTDLFEKLGRYAESYLPEPQPGDAEPPSKTVKIPPFWGDIKQIYVERQRKKCVYCEKRLEWSQQTIIKKSGGNHLVKIYPAKVEWAVEHFRPKGAVKAWPPKDFNYRPDFPTGGAAQRGYFLLAYCLQNYAASCHTCNSFFKRDYFPIAGLRIYGKRDPNDYATEEPYLLYPLGKFDEDPEDIIAFDAYLPIPRHTAAQDIRKFRRGEVNIRFFALDRDDLNIQRAKWLVDAVLPTYQQSENGDPKAAERLIGREKGTDTPFASCTRCFLHLCRTNYAEAERKADECDRYLKENDK